MENYTIEADIRTEKGKGYMRRLRAQGILPGIVYGKDQQNYHLQFPSRILLRFLDKGFSYNIPVDLTVQTENEKIALTTFVKEIQQDPVTGEPLHIDFYAVAPDQKIILPINITGFGEPIGIEKGGLLQQLASDFLAEVTVDNIPRNIKVDLTPLDIGDFITLGQVDVPEHIRLIDNEDKILFQVYIAKKEYLDELPEEEEEETTEEQPEAQPEE